MARIEMGGHGKPRDVVDGLAAAALALLAMVGVAAVALLLLDADRIGGFTALTAAVVALAAGGSAEVSATTAGGLPFGLSIGLRGGLNVMPLGVSLVGAVVLGVLLLRRGRRGLLVRGAAATVALPAGLALVTRLAHGTVKFQLPDSVSAGRGGLGTSGCGKGLLGAALPFDGSSGSPLSGLFNGLFSGPTAGQVGGPGGGMSIGVVTARFSLPVFPVLSAALACTLAVVGVCWLATRRKAVAAGLRAVLWPMGLIAVGCLLAAGTVGGAAAAGGVLLLLPAAGAGLLLLGLGVPWTLSSEGRLSCLLDNAATPSPGGQLVWVSGIVLLAYAIVVAIRDSGRGGGPVRRAASLAARFAPVVGTVMMVMALLARASVKLGVSAFGFSLPVLDARLAANPLLALGAGLAGGAVAGFVASLVVDGLGSRISVSWRAWKDQVRR